jgi:hypothetical protein
MGLVLSTKNLILKELLLMAKHEGLRAWARPRRLANGQTTKHLLDSCKNKRFVRILTLQLDLGAKL